MGKKIFTFLAEKFCKSNLWIYRLIVTALLKPHTIANLDNHGSNLHVNTCNRNSATSLQWVNKGLYKKWIQFFDGSWNHEYFRSLVKLTWSPSESSWNHEYFRSLAKFARDLKYSWFIEIIYNLGDKTILYLIFNRINGFVGVQNGIAEQPVWTRTANGVNKKLVLHVQLRCGSLSITTSVSYLAKNSMFEANCTGKWASLLSIKFCVVHEAMNGCKNLKIHYRIASKM